MQSPSPNPAKVLSWCGTSSQGAPRRETMAAEAAQHELLQARVEATAEGDDWLGAWEKYLGWAEQNAAAASDAGGLKALLVSTLP